MIIRRKERLLLINRKLLKFVVVAAAASYLYIHPSFVPKEMRSTPENSYARRELNEGNEFYVLPRMRYFSINRVNKFIVNNTRT